MGKMKNYMLEICLQRPLILAEYEPNDAVCDAYINNLRSIKKEWVRETGKIKKDVKGKQEGWFSSCLY